MDRRTVLTGVGTALAALAGCTSAANEGSPSDTATPDPASTPGTQHITNRELELRQNCDSPGAAAISVDGEAVVVEGCIVGKNGCQQPVLDSAVYDADTDELQVRVTTEAPSDTEACTQALVELPYRVTVRFENGLPGTTIVVHDGANGEQQAGQAETGGD